MRDSHAAVVAPSSICVLAESQRASVLSLCNESPMLLLRSKRAILQAETQTASAVHGNSSAMTLMPARWATNTGGSAKIGVRCERDFLGAPSAATTRECSHHVATACCG
jgi:hypothetical protein